MNFINQIISTELIHAVGWTIIHSFWQAAFVALILAVLMVFMRRHTSNVRYFVSTAALVVILIIAIITFFYQYNTISDITHHTQKESTIVPAKIIADIHIQTDINKSSTIEVYKTKSDNIGSKLVDFYIIFIKIE